MELEEQLGVMQRDGSVLPSSFGICHTNTRLTANERCARLMAEDPQREIKRAQLKREKETLAKAQDWLANLSADSPEKEIEQVLYTA